MGFNFKGTHVIDYQNHTLATGAKSYKPPFISSCGHSDHIHDVVAISSWQTQTCTCVGRRHSHPSARSLEALKKEEAGLGICMHVYI